MDLVCGIFVCFLLRAARIHSGTDNAVEHSAGPSGDRIVMAVESSQVRPPVSYAVQKQQGTCPYVHQTKEWAWRRALGQMSRSPTFSATDGLQILV